jgi:hypothetical protein
MATAPIIAVALAISPTSAATMACTSEAMAKSAASVDSMPARWFTPAGFRSSVAVLARAQHVPDDRQRSDQQHEKNDPAADPVH